jgi:hypothetical protein
MTVNGFQPHRFRYDIDGIITVASAVRLPELQLFRTEAALEPDLVIDVGPVGGLRPRRRTSLDREGDRLVYREHLGSLASNFEVEMGTPVSVRVGPLLAMSRHVLYTNVVEALLRFLFVRKGRMLLHAACIGLRGQGILLSAKTDTGKTSTILRLLQKEAGVFFSDDMTIIDVHGNARRYPKPLTISAHTLQATPQNGLRVRERVALYLQSRVHSRTGRSVGKTLGQRNLPIMSINSMVQAVVPPPKYLITDLVRCQIGGEIRMSRFFLIERGIPRLIEPVPHEDAVEQLIANTDDAYGFPPYAQLAPQLVIGGDGYTRLRQVERVILSEALRRVPVLRLRVDDFSWPELILDQLAAGIAEPVPAAPLGSAVGRVAEEVAATP